MGSDNNVEQRPNWVSLESPQDVAGRKEVIGARHLTPTQMCPFVLCSIEGIHAICRDYFKRIFFDSNALEKRTERKEAYISKPKIYDRLIVTLLPNTR